MQHCSLSSVTIWPFLSLNVLCCPNCRLLHTYHLPLLGYLTLSLTFMSLLKDSLVPGSPLPSLREAYLYYLTVLKSCTCNSVLFVCGNALSLLALNFMGILMLPAWPSIPWALGLESDLPLENSMVMSNRRFDMEHMWKPNSWSYCSQICFSWAVSGSWGRWAFLCSGCIDPSWGPTLDFSFTFTLMFSAHLLALPQSTSYISVASWEHPDMIFLNILFGANTCLPMW